MRRLPVPLQMHMTDSSLPKNWTACVGEDNVDSILLYQIER